MATLKLSQIAPSPVNPVAADQFVGVHVGNTDELFTLAQIAGGLSGGGFTRTILTANTNYYVSTSGNDSNPGTIGSPWATLQHAFNFISLNLDFGGFTVTINIGAGTFDGAALNGTSGGGALQVYGAGSSLTTINANAAGGTLSAIYINAQCSANLFFQGYKLLGGFGEFDLFGNFSSGNYIQFNGDIHFVPSASVNAAINLGGDTFYQFVGTAGTYTVDGALSGVTPVVFAEVTLGGNSELIGCTFNVTNSFNAGTAVTGFGFWFADFLSSITDFGTTYTGAGSGSLLAAQWGGFINFAGGHFPTPPTGMTVGEFGSADGMSFIENGQQARLKLTANQSFFVATTGNDSNPGSSGSPWATLTHAMAFISENIDINGFSITVNIGAGTFVGLGNRTTVGGGIILFLGAGSSSTTIGNGPNDGLINFGECFDVNFQSSTSFGWDKVTFTPTNASTFAIWAFYIVGCDIFVGNPITLAVTDLVFNTANMAAAAGYIFYGNNIGTFGGQAGTLTIAGNGSLNAAFYIGQGTSWLFNGTWTVLGALTVSTAFLQVTQSYSSVWNFGGSFTVSGSVTGHRFLLQGGASVVNFADSAGTFFPGSTVGKMDPGCSYSGVTDFIGIVASLPSANIQGTRAFVTDALAATFGSAPTGGHAVVVPVYNNGSAWIMG